MTDTVHSSEQIKRVLAPLSRKSDWFRELVELVAGHEPFHEMDSHDILNKINAMHRESKFPNSADGAFEALKKEFTPAAQAKINDIASDIPHANGGKRSFVERLNLDDMTVSKGMGLLIAGMSIFGAISSAQHIISKDEQGHNKVNFTPLAWTLGQGALAAGTAYLTLRNPQVAAHV